MREEIPVCKDCGQPMIEVGGIGKDIQYFEANEDGSPKFVAVVEQKLYQCPEDKTVAIA